MRIAVLLIALASLLPAQAQRGQKEKRDSIKKAMLVELKAYRSELIKTELDLNDATASKFFPIYDPYFKNVSDLRRNFKKKWRKKKKGELTETEASQYLNDILAMRKKEIDLLEQVSKDLKGILPSTKIILLPSLERKVKKKLLKKAKELRKEAREKLDS